MKTFIIKMAAPLFLVFFMTGMVHYADAAFPGKKAQPKEVSAAKSNTEAANTARPYAAPLAAADDNTILLIVLAFILPPLAVYLKYNEAGTPFIWNIILTLLFWVPGVIHALIHILK